MASRLDSNLAALYGFYPLCLSRSDNQSGSISGTEDNKAQYKNDVAGSILPLLYLFNYFSIFHDHNKVGYRPHCSEVVRDKHVGHI